MMRLRPEGKQRADDADVGDIRLRTLRVGMRELNAVVGQPPSVAASPQRPGCRRRTASGRSDSIATKMIDGCLLPGWGGGACHTAGRRGCKASIDR